MKEMRYFFQDGLIGHKVKDIPGGWDFGDSSAECGRYWFGMWFLRELGYDCNRWPWSDLIGWSRAASFLEIVLTGLWHRHPVQYSEPSDWSRDQQISVQCCLSLYGQMDALKRMLFRQWLRLGKYQNRDFRTWEWALDFRCLGWWWMYPLILVLDLGLVINVLIRGIMYGYNKDNVGDDLNLTVLILFCNHKYPSPLSLLAKWLYSKRDLKKAWDHYYRHDENPPINEVYKPLIDRLIS